MTVAARKQGGAPVSSAGQPWKKKEGVPSLSTYREFVPNYPRPKYIQGKQEFSRAHNRMRIRTRASAHTHTHTHNWVCFLSVRARDSCRHAPIPFNSKRPPRHHLNLAIGHRLYCQTPQWRSGSQAWQDPTAVVEEACRPPCRGICYG